MKVHYINILLFALPLNILKHNQRNHKSTTHHTPKIRTTRLLCECELYAPANYDNDPQMKEVMQQFEDRTTQRFHEYDDRMQSKRRHCRERCDKEIQKIILKDKLEKQMAEQLTTLETKIYTDDIPTCICEKSIADKVEKGCFRCAGVLGGGVAPGWGLISGLGYAAWLNVARAAATKYATKKGIEAGVQAVIAKIDISFQPILGNVQWSKLITGSNYKSIPGLVKAVNAAVDSCENGGKVLKVNIEMARSALSNAQKTFVPYVKAGENAYNTKVATVEAAKFGEVTTQSTELYTGIGYSVLAIIIIILIMVIIYLILRHRRKKKMKKKLQYIKLLEE
ncbi:rifin PIR protein, putative [Plasmodium reichenowi]|uniref:Rifin PIR protein, putative n=1 Tax=Plasmodium reichenowi TaxID=5854 RepID=A0A2P9D503_PLARE|nr:rifin PIR protein, putative [Plasmodium reichenowi]